MSLEEGRMGIAVGVWRTPAGRRMYSRSDCGGTLGLCTCLFEEVL